MLGMANGNGIVTAKGFSDAQRPRAAQLYWEAFSAKLGVMLGPSDRGTAFLKECLDPRFAITASAEDGTLLGLAGFKTPEGALAGFDFATLRAHYGWSALWRTLLLMALDREVQPGVLLADGICVCATARGKGLGTALLQAIKAHAAENGFTSVRLDVIDSNPRARALYLREGFETKETQELGLLRHVYGFRSAERMEYAVLQHPHARRDAAN